MNGLRDAQEEAAQFRAVPQVNPQLVWHSDALSGTWFVEHSCLRGINFVDPFGKPVNMVAATPHYQHDELHSWKVSATAPNGNLVTLVILND